MSRILLLGTGPLLEDGKIFSGQCLRTWHFAAPLLKAGYEIDLFTVPIPGCTIDDSDRAFEKKKYKGHIYRAFCKNAEHEILPTLRKVIRKRKPDVLLGVNAYPAALLAKVRMAAIQEGNELIPFWADLNGWTMAEGQVRAARLAHDNDYHHFWRQEALTVLLADRLSAVGERQAHALYGELAMLGRLGSKNFDEPLATAVPNAVYPVYAGLDREPGVPVFLKNEIKSDGKICLWSGGFNSWTDIHLLVAALKLAMKERAELHFVATGGAIVGHDEKTYEDFQALAAEELPEERVHLLGWTDFSKVIELHRCAHVGINIDGTNTETLFGARNRLTNMMGAGLPVVTTQGTEIADWMRSHGVGRVVDTEAQSLARALMEVIAQEPQLDGNSQPVRDLVLRAFAPEDTLKGLLGWLQAPQISGDLLATLDHEGFRSDLLWWALRVAQDGKNVLFDKNRRDPEGLKHHTKGVLKSLKRKIQRSSL